MLKIFTLGAGLIFALLVQAEEMVTGTLEEIISDNFESGKMEHSFSIKDEESGTYYFIDAEEIKRNNMKSGDRIRMRGERDEKFKFHIIESRKIELEEDE